MTIGGIPAASRLQHNPPQESKQPEQPAATVRGTFRGGASFPGGGGGGEYSSKLELFKDGDGYKAVVTIGFGGQPEVLEVPLTGDLEGNLRAKDGHSVVIGAPDRQGKRVINLDISQTEDRREVWVKWTAVAAFE